MTMMVALANTSTGTKHKANLFANLWTVNRTGASIHFHLLNCLLVDTVTAHGHSCMDMVIGQTNGFAM